MIHMHAVQRIFFNDHFPYRRHLFQGHRLVAGIIDRNDLFIFYDIGPHLSKENTMSANTRFRLVRSDFLRDKSW